MGLITKWKYVSVNNKRLAQYYENLGYEIPTHKVKNGCNKFIKDATIYVESKDFSDGIIVEVSCDECNKKLKMVYSEYKNRYGKYEDGKILCKNCISKYIRGKNSPHWRFDLSDEERELNRDTPENIEFIKKVLARDNYTCQVCGKSNCRLSVHHLDGWNWCKEKRYDEQNAVTLCDDKDISCHKSFHSIYGYGNNTKEQFEKFIGYALDNLDKYDGKLPMQRQIYSIDNNKVYTGANEVMLELGLNGSSGIYQCCARQEKTCNKRHFIWYEDYLNMTEEDLDNYIKWINEKTVINRPTGKHSATARKIICVTTNEIFDAMVEAVEKYKTIGATKCTIFKCCKHQCVYAGKIDNFTYLQWMYYDEYLEVINSNRDIFEYLKYINKDLNDRRIICTTTNEIFIDSTEAAKTYGYYNGTILQCANGTRQSGGKTKDGSPLIWMHYKDYIYK